MTYRRLFPFLLSLLAAVLHVPAQLDENEALDTVVASVEGTLITEMDLDHWVLERRLEDPTLWAYPEEELRQAFLPEAVDEVLLYRHFWKPGETTTPDQVRSEGQKQWERWLGLAGSQADLKAALKDSKLDADQARRWLERRAERRWHVETGLLTKVDPALYDERAATPESIRRVRIAHILILPATSHPNSWEDARLRAAEIRFVIADGFPFDRAARVYSDDEDTSARGGDLGWVEPAALSPALREAALRLRLDEVSEPLRTDAGWHLVTVLDLESEQKLRFRKALLDVQKSLLAKFYQESEIHLASGYRLSSLDPNTAKEGGL